MGYTISHRKRTWRILASPLSHFAGWRLVIDCAGRRCPRGRAYDVSQLVEVYHGLTVSGAIRRTRCSQCGCSPSAAAMKSPIGHWLQQEVVLVGTGIH
jgi:hypothetical protein